MTLSGYNTPTEIELACKIFNPDAFGKASVSEAILAKSLDIKVIGISCIDRVGNGEDRNRDVINKFVGALKFLYPKI